ncbi:MAG: XdhC family protein [Syntrophomonadaceae bacterium]|nr:XdhC family protein [Syntrophomonadaceae bacterium]
MMNIFREAVELLKNKESFVMATIFDKVGSAPRTAGAKMIVRGNGAILGTIGGGKMEADAIKLAREIFSSRKTMIQSFDLTSSDIAATDMICGGRGELLLDFVDAVDINNLILYESAAEALENREKAWLITILNDHPDKDGILRQQCLVKSDKTYIGKVDCDPYVFEKLISGPAKISIHAEVIDNQRFLVEPIRQGGTVYIFGAGHVSQRVALASESVGFRTVVLDDRAEFANKERFPEPIQTMVIETFERLPKLEIDENSYLVILTRGHLYDRIVLQQVLRSGAGYIGMIGSRSKTAKIYEELIRQGYHQEELEQVYAPIGMNIGAETPEELAVSIVGELIKVRAEKENIGKKPKTKDEERTCCRILES